MNKRENNKENRKNNKNHNKSKEKSLEELKKEIEEILTNNNEVIDFLKPLEKYFLGIEKILGIKKKLEKLFGKNVQQKHVNRLINQMIKMSNNYIVKINKGKFYNDSLSMNERIMKICGGEFYNDSLDWNEGIIIINGGEFSDDSLEDNQGIMKIGGGEFYNFSLRNNQEIIIINKGKFHDMSLIDNQGIIKINGGELHDWSLSWNEGIVVIDGGELHDNSLISNYGFVKISENVALNDVVAGDMQDGLLYVMNKDAVIGSDEKLYGRTLTLKGGLVIAPNGAKEIYNEGAAVFTVDEDVDADKAVIFIGEAEIDGHKYTASDVLKELGDYVWETSTNKFINDDIDNGYKSAIKVMKKISERYAGKSKVIDVSELLKSYDGSKGIGEFIYKMLPAW